MFTLPTPLHPLIVHFPIVLIILGAVVAVASFALHRWPLPWHAASLLVLGSIGSFVASYTGETAEDQAGALTPAAEVWVEAHESAAERTEAAAAVAALLATAAAALGTLSRRRCIGEGALSKIAFGLRTAAAVVALCASYFVYETGHAGGKLVYQFGVGVKTSADGTGPSAARARADRD